MVLERSRYFVMTNGIAAYHAHGTINRKCEVQVKNFHSHGLLSFLKMEILYFALPVVISNVVWSLRDISNFDSLDFAIARSIHAFFL